MNPDTRRAPPSSPHPELPATDTDADATQAETAGSAVEPVIDEIDINLGEPDASDLALAGTTEYLGSYSSIPAYLRAMLEPEVSPACVWILAHLDYAAIQRRWESDGSRLLHSQGHVYHVVSSGSANDPRRLPKP
jgi:hypothetical protein